MNIDLIKIKVEDSVPQREVKLNTPYKTIGGDIRFFIGYNQQDYDKFGMYRTAYDSVGSNVYSRLHNQWGCDNGRVTGAKNDDPNNLLAIDGEFIVECHPLHLDNPNQYDTCGRFIIGSGEVCPNCGVEWEDKFAIAVCPCLDEL